jgi:hypothetical protein
VDRNVWEIYINEGENINILCSGYILNVGYSGAELAVRCKLKTFCIFIRF